MINEPNIWWWYFSPLWLGWAEWFSWRFHGWIVMTREVVVHGMGWHYTYRRTSSGEDGGRGWEGEGWALTRWSDIDMKIWEGMGRQMVACGSIYVHRGVMERDFCIYPWRRLRLRLRPQSSILDP
ncbi:hypothetical protein EYC84_004091 [Monilinia fructicola]|uniref:Uncharacterized protein n=1 Tax=Monilinia fructicola TaxID=38448 RepID=A0A5M9K1Z5_MONFR|nr:hypothetical protein EYC84_004091 [Monilinia fructicola]